MTAQPGPGVPMLRIPRSADPVTTTPRLRSAHLPVWAYVVVIVSVLAGSIVVARDLGWFATTGRGSSALGAAEVPGSHAEPGTAAGPGSGSQEHAAPTTGAVPDDVKGWMTVRQVLDAFPVSRARLYQRFGIPADTPTDTTLSRLKETGSASGFDVPALRIWLGEQVAG
jgi:hypothetical protein